MDFLTECITGNGHFRAYITNMTQLVTKSANIHKTSSDATIILGEALICTAIMGKSLLKGKDKLNVKINGRGQIGQIVTETNTPTLLRGYVTNTKAKLSANRTLNRNYSDLVGTDGFISVTKLQDELRPYVGEVPLVKGRIDRDFNYYLVQSEQIPSYINARVLVNPRGRVDSAGGFMLQPLPGASELELNLLEQHIKRLPNIALMLSKGMTVKQILKKVFGKEKININENKEVGLAPNLPKKWYAQALKKLPDKDIMDMINEDHGAEVTERYTEKAYYFSEEELKDILLSKRKRK